MSSFFASYISAQKLFVGFWIRSKRSSYFFPICLAPPPSYFHFKFVSFDAHRRRRRRRRRRIDVVIIIFSPWYIFFHSHLKKLGCFSIEAFSRFKPDGLEGPHFCVRGIIPCRWQLFYNGLYDTNAAQMGIKQLEYSTWVGSAACDFIASKENLES